MAAAAAPQVHAIDLEKKAVVLRKGARAFNGSLVAGGSGFCMAEFDDRTLNFQTDVPNLMLSIENKKMSASRKRPATALKRPAAAELPPAGHVYDSEADDGECSDEADTEECAEEERPLVKDPVLDELEDEPAQAEAPPDEVAEPPLKYGKMYYKAQHSIGIRRGWVEEGFKAGRQCIIFGGKKCSASKERLVEIADAVVAKLASREMTEAQAQDYARAQL